MKLVNVPDTRRDWWVWRLDFGGMCWRMGVWIQEWDGKQEGGIFSGRKGIKGEGLRRVGEKESIGIGRPSA